MALTTLSKFYYGLNITSTNYKIDFDEGGSALEAALNLGDYTLTSLCLEIARALNYSGDLTYSCTVNRSTRVITISTSSGNFSLLNSTGSNKDISVLLVTAGFPETDVTGSDTYAGTTGAAKVFENQFLLQKYVDFEDFEESSYSSVNESAGGIVEVVSFGTTNYMTCSIDYQTNVVQPSGSLIENQSGGLDNLRTFLRAATAKGKMEFMPDKNNESNFTQCLLESSSSHQSGTGYRLKEYLGRLPGYHSSGLLKFRKVV